MRFALINDNRVEAQPQLKGLCPCCSNPVIAKCGRNNGNLIQKKEWELGFIK